MISLSVAVLLALSFIFSCSSDGGAPSLSVGYTGSYDSVSYEGQTYKTVRIGGQTWFAENLNYNVSSSKCYDNSDFNCVKYGRLYDWSTAMGFDSSCNSNICSDQINRPHRGICPSGWHIPSRADWDELFYYVDSIGFTPSKYLKATSGWNNNGNGTNAYGFSALPSGYGDLDGSFDGVGYLGYWWTTGGTSSYGAYCCIMHYKDTGDECINDYATKSFLFSIRCLQD
ncbi:MAG: hypothetical protein LBQ76_01745 [Candidatus Fibromonas sp.]|jgi:uncharacterized protein (TIGR02145 family)|nr:hypothetical protein [Candidatus Fibromonas sp.]